MIIASQERIIERLKEQRERDDRERLEEIESFRKENKDLKEKVNALQAELTEKEVSLEKQMNHADSSIHGSLKRLESEFEGLCEVFGDVVTFPWQSCLNSKENIDHNSLHQDALCPLLYSNHIQCSSWKVFLISYHICVA